MNKSLIFLYGLPGVGKLTVALALEKLTGWKVFHNHLTSDFVHSVINREAEIGQTEDIPSLLKQTIRTLMIDTWFKHFSTPMITTLLYKKGKNEHYFNEMSNAAKRHGAKVYYFHLKCDYEVLKKRVTSPARAKFDKLLDVDGLEKKMNSSIMTEDLPFENNFVINTTNLSPEDTAKKIVSLLECTK